MVANIGKGKDLYGALAYNMEKVDNKNAIVLFSNNMNEPPNGEYTIPICMRSFEPYLIANKKTEKTTIHISLNPHPDDKVDDELFAKLANEYMNKLGYAEQPYIVFKHEDIDRTHIHIVSVNMDENGNRINDAFQKRISKKATQELEKKYGLLSADKLSNKDLLNLKPINLRAGNIKKQIATVTHSLVKSYDFQSLAQYRALLSLYNVTVEEVKGEVRGRAYNGLVYSALDKKGIKRGNPFKASLIGQNVGYENLQNKFKQSKLKTKDKSLYDVPKIIITKVLSENPKRKNFERELLKEGISVVFRQNEDKRIYGVTFIDHHSKMVFNGSMLGKEFSANTFENIFNESSKTSFLEENPHKETYIEGSLSLFSFDSQGIDYEEEAFASRMKRKKRKRPKL